MRKLTVFYDHKCGLCRACRRWLAAQPTYFALEFVPYDSPTARAICPEIGKLDPDQQIVAMADNGDIYRGGAAWVMCLYATRSQRPLAMKLAHPKLLPIAKKACAMVAKNRLRISSLLHLRGEGEIAEAAEFIGRGGNCREGVCHE